MTMDDLSLAGRAAELRRAFDRSFADARSVDRPATEDLLAIRVGGDPYALRLSEIAGLVADKRITRVPGPVSALLGLAGLRGAVVSVYDLSALMGYRASVSPRWLALTAGIARIGLAFDQLEGHVRVPLDALSAEDGADTRRDLVRGIVRVDNVARRLLHVPSILEDVGRRSGAGSRQKER
jgi:chemotaxis signal transduction protein